MAAFSAVVASPTSALADDVLPASPLTLSLAAGTGGGPWKVRVENTGEAPIRLAADPRVLTLEVTPPAGTVVTTTKKKPGAKPEPTSFTCTLPADSRPSTDDGSELVVPSRRSWSHTFDPFFYCFGARERAALVTGATVVARLGWTTPTPRVKPKKPAPLAPPFVASPVGAGLGRFAAAKQLESAPITLTEAVTALPASPTPPPPAGPGVGVSMSETADFARGKEMAMTVTAANEQERAATLLFRTETLRFTVNGPAGSVSCGAPKTVDAPIRELFTTLGVKGKTSLTLLVDAVCPVDTFDAPGVYRVTAMLDTSGASGKTIGLRTWDGEARAKQPALVRVRAPRRAGSPASARPTLD